MLSRRSLLFGAGTLAGGTVLAACSSDGQGGDRGGPAGDSGKSGSGKSGSDGSGKAAQKRKGSRTDPLKPPGSYAEAPSLRPQVKAGTLPPVRKRLPDHPYVIPHRWTTTGKYGGTLRLVTPASDDSSIYEYSYAHSPLRWLNDGLDIGPGLAESWESNDDASTWTLHFRNGLRWSDGHPWTTRDVMFWWNDMVRDDEYAEAVPHECRSGKGTLATLSAPDDFTIRMEFDAPAPLVPDLIANTVNRGVLASWTVPAHYLKKFHKAHNKSLGSDWTERFDQKKDFRTNPDVPTLTAWRLAAYKEGSSSTWERNPYCYVVDPDGHQLPYVDRLVFDAVDNVDVRKLKVQHGDYDFVHGAFAGLTLSDISGLKGARKRSGMHLELWDSGSGTGSMFFFNFDYDDPKLRKLFRDKTFRQALSYAFDRAKVRKTVYYNTGELTTGTYSGKTQEFTRGHGGAVYKKWRDSYVDHDPARAKKMLDSLGLADADGDGFREHPDGSKLKIRINYPSGLDTHGEHLRKDEQLARDWKAVGIDATVSPVSETSLATKWALGEVMSKSAWEVSTLSLAADMLWIIPMENTRWAPLEGQYYALRGTGKADAQADVSPYKRTPPRMAPEAGGPVEKLWKISDQIKLETDRMKRDRLAFQMVKIHVQDGPFFMGPVANYPQIEMVKSGLRNVPKADDLALHGFVNDWNYPVPAAYDPECWFWDDPGSHE